MSASFRAYWQHQRGESQPTSGVEHTNNGAGGLSRVLASARASGTLNLSNRGLGPSLPPEVCRLHDATTRNGDGASGNVGFGGNTDERFWDNVDLRALDVSLNVLETLPEEIGDVDTGLPHLVKLVARNNLLRALPLSVTQLTQLVVLDVSHNQLEMLPPLEELQALVELCASHNRLRSLPSFNQLCTNSGTFLPRLATVHVSNNQLSHLPDEIGYLPSLQMLDCGHNALATLPLSLSHATFLAQLLAPHNRLGVAQSLVVPPPAVRGGAATISVPQFSGCKALKVLDLRENSLQAPLVLDLPSSLAQLFLSFNPLGGNCSSSSSSSVVLFGPSNVEAARGASAIAASSIAEVHLASCGLVALPEELGGLSHLHTIDVSANDLGDLPPNLGWLPALSKIPCQGNPMRRVRRGLLDGPVSALKAFLRTRGPPHPVLPSHLVARDSGAPDGAGVSTETNDPTTNGGSPALILALRDAAASKQLDLSQWARKMTTGSSDSGAVTGLLPRPNSAGSNRFSSRPGSISSSSGGGGSSSANGPFNGPDSVDSALALLDTLMSGDVGGHWDDDAWDRVRPAAGCLTKLNLSGNYTSPSLPTSLPMRCPALKELIVADNRLEALWITPSLSINSSISSPVLPCLTFFDASGNRLAASALNAAFHSLSPTHSGSSAAPRISRNPHIGTQSTAAALDGIVRGAGSSISKLKHLDLRRNGLAELPQSMFRLTELQTLLLGYNSLTNLPCGSSNGKIEERHSRLKEGTGVARPLADFVHTTSDSVSVNTSLGWGALQMLGYLDLSGNKLNKLGKVPSELVNCTLLRNLDLSDNDLREIPPEVGLLTSLNVLTLHGNPQRGIRGGTISAGVEAVLAALRLKLPENYSVPQPKPATSSPATTNTSAGRDRGVNSGVGNSGTDGTAVHGSAEEVAAGMNQLSMGDNSIAVGSIGSNRSSNSRSSANSGVPGALNPASVGCALPHQGHDKYSGGNREAFENPRSEWPNDSSEVGGANLGGDSRLLHDGRSGGLGGSGFPIVGPSMGMASQASPDWLPQPGPHKASVPLDESQLLSTDSFIQPPQEHPRYQRSLQHQQPQQQRETFQRQLHELQSSYQRNQSSTCGSSHVGAPSKFTGYSSMAAPLHVPGPLPSSSFAAAGQRCTTCGSVERLEPDVDNPGDVYCAPCWEAYEAAPVEEQYDN